MPPSIKLKNFYIVLIVTGVNDGSGAKFSQDWLSATVVTAVSVEEHGFDASDTNSASSNANLHGQMTFAAARYQPAFFFELATN